MANADRIGDYLSSSGNFSIEWPDGWFHIFLSVRPCKLRYPAPKALVMLKSIQPTTFCGAIELERIHKIVRLISTFLYQISESRYEISSKSTTFRSYVPVMLDGVEINVQNGNYVGMRSVFHYRISNKLRSYIIGIQKFCSSSYYLETFQVSELLLH